MGIRADHFRKYVVEPVLAYLEEKTGNDRIDCPAAVRLIMGTFAHESHLCEYLRQHPTGPARGGGQMEEATYYSLWENYLKHRPELADAVRSLASVKSINAGVPDFSEVIGNLNFAVAMTRVRYLPAPQRLPEVHDLNGLAEYHRRWYNRGGDAEVHEFIRDMRLYVDDDA